MDEKLKAKILFEISQIERLLKDSEPLLKICKSRVPDFIEISAAAMILHSFYNGIENILRLITKHYDGKLPNSTKWHLDLLDKAFVSDENRKQLFPTDVQRPLEEYMKFRHFVRHAYGFQLEWEMMEDLTNGIENIWKILRENVNNFLENA